MSSIIGAKPQNLNWLTQLEIDYNHQFLRAQKINRWSKPIDSSPMPLFSSSNQTQVSALQTLNRSINQHKCIKRIDFYGTPAKGVRPDDEIEIGGRRTRSLGLGDCQQVWNDHDREEIVRGREKSESFWFWFLFGLKEDEMTRFDFVFDSTTPDFCSFFLLPFPLSSSLFITTRDYSFNFCRYFMEKKVYLIDNPYSFV